MASPVAVIGTIVRATAPLVYIRLHGPDSQHLYAGSYSDDNLRWWADRCPEWTGLELDVFAYFNVVYALTPTAARQGVTRRRWIDIKTVERHADGSTTVSGTTDTLFFALQELLHYRYHCRVLGGPQLLAEMRQTVNWMDANIPIKVVWICFASCTTFVLSSEANELIIARLSWSVSMSLMTR